MSGCKGLLPAGNNNNCVKTAGNLKQPIFMDSDVVFDSIAEAKKLSNWASKILEFEVWSAKLYDWENATEDANVITSNSGDKMQTNTAQLAYSFYLKVNPCDWYNIMKKFNGATYRMAELYQSGSIAGTMQSEKFTGYLVDVFATFKGAIKDDFNVYKVDVYYKDTDNEVIQNGVMFTPDFAFASEYSAITPASVTLAPISEYATDTITVSVESCGTPITGLETADFEVIKSDAAAAITLTVAAGSNDGEYDITTSAALSSYESVTFRVNKTGDTVSNDIYVLNK